jgi:hypothetical protein
MSTCKKNKLENVRGGEGDVKSGERNQEGKLKKKKLKKKSILQ